MSNHTFGDFKMNLTKKIHYFIRTVLLFIISKFFRVDKSISDVHISHAFYAPWKDDLEFMNQYKLISNYTICDVYRLFSIWYLFSQIKNQSGKILDIGCYKGGISFLLSKLDKKNKFYFIDTFEGHKKISKEDGILIKQGQHKYSNILELEKNIKNFSILNYQILKGIFPDETLNEIELKNIKFVHLDVNLASYTKKILFLIKDKMVNNGIIVIDDYGITSCEEITKFVNQVSKELNNEFHFFYNYFGQAVMIKKIKD